MSEWPIVPLREVSEVITKGTTPTTLGMAFTESGVNFIKSESITGDGCIDVGKFAFIDEATHASLKRSQIKANDLLFSMAGVYLGKTAVVPLTVVPANTNQAVAIIRLKKEIADPRYVGYFLRQPSFNAYVNNLVGQSAQPNINLTEIGRLEIKLPPLETQLEIARILGDLDDKIELNRQINQTQEQIAQTIFKSWFVDFEPVKAKIEAKAAARDPERAAMCAISGKLEPELDQLHPEQYQQLAATAALFPDELAESELGLIPSGWIAGSYADLYSERKEKVKTRKDVNVLSAVQTGVLKDPDEVFNKQVHSQDISKYKVVFPGDLAFNPSRINIGSAGFNDFNFFGAVSPVYTVMCLHKSVTLPFAKQHLKYPAVKSQIESLCSGSVRQSLSAYDFITIPVVLPNNEILEIYNLTSTVFRNHSQNLMNNVESLAELRDLLLPKLLSGEIQIADAENQLAGVM